MDIEFGQLLRHSQGMTLLAQADRTTVERRFEFAALPEGWAAVIALGGVVLTCWAIVWMYRREGRRGASMTVRTLLAAVRCVVVLALVSIWLEPILATYLHRWIDSYAIVLVDDSSSMDLRDRYRIEADAARIRSVMDEQATGPTEPETKGVRRADVVGRLLSRDQNRFLRELTRRNRVKLYSFSDSLELAASLRAVHEEGGNGPQGSEAQDPDDAANVRTTFAAQGAATNVSRAVRRSIESLGGAPLAGVVLFSDGGFNQGDPVEVLARYVEEQQIPLHVVGIGDASPPQNVRISEAVSPNNAFKEDPFTITTHITTQGMVGETITVELYERDGSAHGTQPAGSEGKENPVETRTVRITTDGVLDPIVFTRRREEVGRVTYRVAVPVGPYESVADDNSKQTVVNVIDDKMRVLLIAGSPSWEYRYVSRLLIRDATFDVSCWLQSAAVNAVRDGNTIIDQLPATPEELLVYDAVILIDPDPLEFGPGWARSLDALVTDHGGGVLYVASRKYTPQFMRDPAVGAIVKLLPVKLDPEADLILNKVGHYQTRAWPIEIPRQALGHTILGLGDERSDSRATWSQVPGVYWHYPVLREKPVASVLMRHSNPQMRNSYGGHVLAATQFVGSGRSAFLAFDSTWRWRRQGEEVFNGFWVQMLRYLVEGKLLGAKKRATILTEGSTFQLGRTINVTARLFDARFGPLEVDSVTATYRVGSRPKTFTLKRSLDQPGWYEGRFTPAQIGEYEVLLTLPGGGGSAAVTVGHHVEVVRPNIEILNPQMNRAALKMLAERSAGGRYYEIDEADKIPNAILDRHESTTVKSRPVQLWDNKWTLMLLIGLLSVEWAVRKWVRLL